MTGPVSAMWVWTEGRWDPAALTRFTDANGLREIYLSVPWEVSSAHARLLAETCRQFEARGIAVAALGGTPEWAENPGDAAIWTRRALSAAPFSRIHLDIEPWAHPRWDTAADRLGTGYLTAVQSACETSGGLPVDVDVAHFLGAVARPQGSLLDEVVALADRLTVMAYRGVADEVVDLATPTIAAAADAGIPCSVGVQAGAGSDRFHTVAELLDSALAIKQAFSEVPAFGGVVVHDHRSWERLPGG